MNLILPAVLAIGILWLNRGWKRTYDSLFKEYERNVDLFSETVALNGQLRKELAETKEKLDFSDDVRNVLGIQNAKLTEQVAVHEERIEGFKRDIERGEDTRCILVETVGNLIDLHQKTERQLDATQRSLRIARHKEWKRWKKGVLVGWRRMDMVRVKPESYGKIFNRLWHIRKYNTNKQYKLAAPRLIQNSRFLKALPLP